MAKTSSRKHKMAAVFRVGTTVCLGKLHRWLRLTGTAEYETGGGT